MNTMTAIAQHYESPDLITRIKDGLGKIGKTPEAVTLDDLAPVDEFHFRGSAATQALIDLLDPKPGMQVLDAGAGLGGPARRLAQARNCKVTGVDLSADYCATGAVLNDWLGLSDRVTLTQGDVTNLNGFTDGAFDAAWTIHVGMNVADKSAFYTEVARVLKPGARFVLYDVLAADSQPEIAYPAPWAKESSTSFLVTLDQMTGHLSNAGFDVAQSQDQSAAGLAFLDANIARAKEEGGPPPLGLHVVLGPVFKEIVPTMRRNFAESSVRLVAVLCRKTDS